MRGVALVILAGCGRVGFDAVGDGGTVSVDAGAPDGLVAFYDMETFVSGGAGSSSLLIDATGRAHMGTCAGTRCPAYTAGHTGMGLTFDGVDDRIDIANAPDLDTRARFTIAVWVNVPGAPLDFSCLVNKIFGSTNGDSYQLCVTPDAAMYFGLNGGLVQSATLTIDPTNWHHVAASWDGAAMALYIDGGLSGTTPLISDAFDAGELVLGIDVDNGTTIAPFTGTLDDVRIYERVLSPAEIAALAGM